MFEINARFSGTTPVRAIFGFNEVGALLDHLRDHGRDYDAVLFWAFRYAEVYFGLPLVAERVEVTLVADAASYAALAPALAPAAAMTDA